MNNQNVPLSSLAAAAAKLSLTPTKVLDGTPAQKRLPSKQYEQSPKEIKRNNPHKRSTNKATPRRNNGGNKGSDGRKQQNPNQFEFYLNKSDSDDSLHGEKSRNRRRDNEEPKLTHQKYRSPATNSHRQNRRNDPDSIKRHGKQQKGSTRDNGRIINVNASRRLIGHALGKRIPTTDRNREKNIETVKAPNQEDQSQIKFQHKKMEYSSPSKTHSGPVLIPSSQLDGQVKVTKMQRWADDESSDED